MPTTFSHAMRIGTSPGFGGLRFPYVAALRSVVPLTVGMLIRANSPTGVALFGIGRAATDRVTLEHSSGGIRGSYSRTGGQQTFLAAGVATAAIDAWRWVFGVFSADGFWLYHGPFDGTLVNAALTVTNVGSGDFITSDTRGPWIGSDGETSSSFRQCDVAFCGLWNAALPLVTAQSYADDLEGNGGLAAALDYWKWSAGDTAGITSAKLAVGVNYTAPVTLIAGPESSPPIVANALRVLTQPVTTPVGSVMPAVTVEAIDTTQGDARDLSFTGPITLAATAAGTYLGTLTQAAAAGVATFGDLVPQTLGTGLSLTATHGAFAPVASAPFNVPLPSAGSTLLSGQELMATPILKNSVDPSRRVVLLRVRKTDGTPWDGSTVGVKPLLNGTPLEADIIRYYGDLHGAQLSQAQSNTNDAVVFVTLPASGDRTFASDVGLVTQTDYTVAQPQLNVTNGVVEANLRRINNQTVLGTGVSGDEFRV